MIWIFNEHKNTQEKWGLIVHCLFLTRYRVSVAYKNIRFFNKEQFQIYILEFCKVSWVICIIILFPIIIILKSLEHEEISK